MVSEAQQGSVDEHRDIVVKDLAEDPSTTLLVTHMIVNSSAMYKHYGMTAPPVLAITTKAFFNYCVAMMLLVGRAMFKGKAEVKKILLGTVQFGKLSMAFQIVGQVSALLAYGLIAYHTQCWTGGNAWQTFTYLVSQHSASTTIVVSVANNAAVRFFIPEDQHTARMAANVLLYTALVVGIPLWVAIATALASPGGTHIITSIVIAVVFVVWADGKPGSFRERVTQFLRDMMGTETEYAGETTELVFCRHGDYCLCTYHAMGPLRNMDASQLLVITAWLLPPRADLALVSGGRFPFRVPQGRRHKE